MVQGRVVLDLARVMIDVLELEGQGGVGGALELAVHVTLGGLAVHVGLVGLIGVVIDGGVENVVDILVTDAIEKRKKNGRSVK